MEDEEIYFWSYQIWMDFVCLWIVYISCPRLQRRGLSVSHCCQQLKRTTTVVLNHWVLTDHLFRALSTWGVFCFIAALSMQVKRSSTSVQLKAYPPGSLSTWSTLYYGPESWGMKEPGMLPLLFKKPALPLPDVGFNLIRCEECMSSGFPGICSVFVGQCSLVIWSQCT